jgi:hypothetical protein
MRLSLYEEKNPGSGMHFINSFCISASMSFGGAAVKREHEAVQHVSIRFWSGPGKRLIEKNEHSTVVLLWSRLRHVSIRFWSGPGKKLIEKMNTTAVLLRSRLRPSNTCLSVSDQVQVKG